MAEPPANPANVMASLQAPVSGMYFFEKDITLDGYIWESCMFEKCTLRSYKGTFALRNCRLSKCQYFWGNEAYKIVNLHRLITGCLRDWPAAVDADGRVTIG